jgi:hypothetical protein
MSRPTHLLTVAGGLYEDGKVLALAAALQAVTDHHLKQPPMFAVKEAWVSLSRREFLHTTAAAIAVQPVGKRKVAVPAHEDDLAYLSIIDLSALLRQKKLSPVEVTKTILTRIERLNPVLNAHRIRVAKAAIGVLREASTRRNGSLRSRVLQAPTGLDPVAARHRRAIQP